MSALLCRGVLFARCAKVLDKRVARLCVLASNCDVDAYKKLVKALCETNNIPIIEVETHALLGEWCGLCKLDKDGNARKVGPPPSLFQHHTRAPRKPHTRTVQACAQRPMCVRVFFFLSREWALTAHAPAEIRNEALATKQQCCFVCPPPQTHPPTEVVLGRVYRCHVDSVSYFWSFDASRSLGPQVAKCSVAVVTDFGESSQEVQIVLNHAKKQ